MLVRHFFRSSSVLIYFSSTKLFHGGLRYLETYQFRLVKEALAERDILLNLMPHISWPLQFVLPHKKGLRPYWMLRFGLYLYDFLAGNSKLPRSGGLNLDKDISGKMATQHSENVEIIFQKTRMEGKRKRGRLKDIRCYINQNL